MTAIERLAQIAGGTTTGTATNTTGTEAAAGPVVAGTVVAFDGDGGFRTETAVNLRFLVTVTVAVADAGH